jgi:hypothetical protein
MLAKAVGQPSAATTQPPTEKKPETNKEGNQKPEGAGKSE